MAGTGAGANEHTRALTRLSSPLVNSTRALRNESPALREQFPVLRGLAYLNAGTDGPLARAAVSAAAAELKREAAEGRGAQHFARRSESSSMLRSAYASILASPAEDIALTTCTSEGIAQVIDGLQLRSGDEIVTSDEEHPGLLGALAAAHELHGVSIRMVALAEVAEAVGARTRLVACSHVGWMSGSRAPAELAAVDVPVLLDGAQGVGAVPVDVAALGCDAYAGAGQKWLCGPDGIGMLHTTAQLRERLAVRRRGYGNLADPNEGLQARPHEDARRFDTLSLSAEATACAFVASEVLATAQLPEGTGWPAVHERSRRLAALLAKQLDERGREVAPRADTTLVSFWSADPVAERARLAQAGVIVRDIPGRPWLRASVGAWNSEEDLQRLLNGLA
jgi:selenocysteine lyase/cysteine desulfurase